MMKKLFIIFGVMMVGVIGVITYFAYPHIKAEWYKMVSSYNQIQTETSRTTQRNVVRRGIASNTISINKGKTDLERTMIIKYNNMVSILGCILEACIENNIDFAEVDDPSNLPEAAGSYYVEYIDALVSFNRFYYENKDNVRRELLEYFTLANSD